MKSSTTTMASIHSSSSSTSSSTHPTSEASLAEVASPPSKSHLPSPAHWHLNTAPSAGDLRVVVTTLVSSLRHHLSDISKVHPNPMRIPSQRKTSHLIDSSCSSVNALVLNRSPPIFNFVADLRKRPEPVKLPLDHLASAPGSETSNPDLGCSVCLSISNLALELSNVLPAQLFFGDSSHVKVLEPDESESIASARRGALDVDVHQFSISPKNSSHLFVRDV